MYAQTVMKTNKCTAGREHNNMLRFLFVLVIVCAFFTCFAIVSAYAGSEADIAEPASEVSKKSIVVGQGDTLWSIAIAHKAQNQDIRNYIDNLKKVNGLKSSILKEGQMLYLP
jgi:cell division protein YceG involved in septum cleavage